MARRNTNTRYDLKSVVDRYIQDQIKRLGPMPEPIFIPVPVTPKRNRRKSHA